MAIAALSPNSIAASPVQVNPQVRTDLQASTPQVAQDAQKTAQKARTDTVTLSAQALKMADDKNATAEEAAARRADEQEALAAARDKAETVRNEAQRSAEKAYAVANVERK